MRRRDFEVDARILGSITQADMQLAADEEAKNQPISNPAVQVLKKTYTRNWRSAIIYISPPNLQITLNPHDLDDPIAQVFAGEEIDMDRFLATAGPDKNCCAKNIAADPYAAAKFFHFTIKVVLETLFGIKVTEHKVKSTPGILGEVNAYIGTVKSQGRATLHLHLLVWLKNAPSADEMHILLKSEHFHAKVSEYIKANMCGYLPGMSNAKEVQAIPIERELAYSRPPNPDSPDFDNEAKELERRLAETEDGQAAEDGNDKVILEGSPDKGLTIKCQVIDYKLHGDELEEYNLIDFFVDTYDVEITSKDKERENRTAINEDQTDQRTRGRSLNIQSRYLIGHPKNTTRQWIVRCSGHMTLPNFIGRNFPRSDNPDTYEFYCAAMLLLLKPWREVSELKNKEEGWYNHESQTAAHTERGAHEAEAEEMEGQPYRVQQETDNETEPNEDVVSSGSQLTEAGLQALITLHIPWREELYARQAVEIGKSAKIFGHANETWHGSSPEVRPALIQDLQRMDEWKNALAQDSMKDTSHTTSTRSHEEHTGPGHGGQVTREEYSTQHVHSIHEEVAEEALTAVEPSCLLTAQR
ncbi:hypothetical protein JB92DRAFT_3131919 [Gautieria morchelliformis]|nr:hypothetical protein JB92DRAFT_3131919 [Gautieria morchelliformis]